MTYIPVQGGLGNQLFIFAMAHYLEEESDLKIVLTFKRDRFNQGHRDNFLPEFIQNCTHNIVIKNGNVINLLLKIVDKIDSISHKAASSIKQTFKIIDFEAPDDFEHQQFYNARIVRGFFQSGDLVEKVWPKLRNEFAESIDIAYKKISEKKEIDIRTLLNNYQCIHIRRGDYLENSRTLGVLSKEYFLKNTIIEMPTIITTDTFYDLNFCGRFPDVILLNQYEINPVEAVALMSHASRLVMSNSTLSWWGSRLALENGADVIAPNPWFISFRNNQTVGLSDRRFQVSESIFE